MFLKNQQHYNMGSV